MKTKNLMMCGASISAAIVVLLTIPKVSAAADERAGTDDQNVISEILVTAQRREENEQNVAISITTLNADSVKTLQTSADIGALVPNIQSEQTAGIGNNRLGIRGIAQGDFNNGSTTSNMVYLDDLPMNSMIAQGVPVWDVGRAEVLRGPQGTLFGRNATGGAIRYISEAPTNNSEGYAEATYGNSNQREFRGAISGPITDSIRARASFISNQRDGDVTNVILHRRQNEENFYGARLIVNWDATDALKATFKAQVFDSHFGSLAWKSTPGLPTSNGLNTVAHGFNNIGDVQASYGFQNLGPASGYTLSESNGFGVEHIRHVPISLNLDWNVGFATLTSVTGYLHAAIQGDYDIDASPASIADAYEPANAEQWSQEFRMTSNNDGPFNWIAGLFYLNENLDDTINVDATARWTNNPDGFPGDPNGVFYKRSTVQDLKTYAGFLHTTYQVTPKLMLTAAARYTYERKNVFYGFRHIYDFSTSVPGTAFEYADFLNTLASGNYGALLRAADPEGDNGNAHFSATTWKAAINYQATDLTLLYVLVSKGFKGGSFQPTANSRSDVALDPNAPIKAINPETVIDYEGGMKTTFWDGHARVNGAVFYYSYKDYQTNAFTPEGDQAFVNLPAAKLYGAELEVELKPVPHLDLNVGVGYTHSKITEVLFPDVPENAALLGNKLPLAEDFNFNGTIGYELITPIGSVTPEVSAKHYGKYQIDKENHKELGDFTLFNARIGFESSSRKVYGSLWIKNIANTVRPIAIDDFSETFGSDIAYVNQRRRFGVSAGIRF